MECEAAVSYATLFLHCCYVVFPLNGALVVYCPHSVFSCTQFLKLEGQSKQKVNDEKKMKGGTEQFSNTDTPTLRSLSSLLRTQTRAMNGWFTLRSSDE